MSGPPVTPSRRYPGLAQKRLVVEKDEDEEREETGAVQGALEGWGTYLRHPVMKVTLGLITL